MAKPRAELDEIAMAHMKYDDQYREQAEELHHQLNLLGITRRNVQTYQEQARQLGTYAPPMIVNGIRHGVAEIRRLKAAYTTLATRYQKYFPGLDTEIEDVPQVDFDEEARADDGL